MQVYLSSVQHAGVTEMIKIAQNVIKMTYYGERKVAIKFIAFFFAPVKVIQLRIFFL